jgi:Icc-related predicted phosphoesterase
MRISVVADVHGNIDALARIAETAEKLVILGDLLDYVDYHDPNRGILAEMFGAESVRHFTVLRSHGEFAELRRYNAALWGSLADPVGVLSGMVQRRYRQVLDVIPDDAVVTLGNVDVAAEWNRVAGDRIPYRDGEVVHIDGLRFAFVAGGVHRAAVSEPPLQAAAPAQGSAGVRPWQPMMRPYNDYQRLVHALPDADVLCSHVPPDLPILRYDVVPGRVEMAGPGLTAYMRRVRPRLALFGHVHQPLFVRRRYYMTECINVGHFQRAERAYVVDTDRLRTERTA